MDYVNQFSTEAKILALRITGMVGPRTFEMLLAHFKTVDAIFEADEEELRHIDGIGKKRSLEIFEARDNLEKAQKIIDNLGAFDAKTVIYSQPEYPVILNEINDPPPLLFYRGHLPEEQEKRVAIIGSQDVSAEGIGDAVELASRLVENNVSIVGGLARGIDTAGHIGALKAGGRTYAVLPCGIDTIYPSENEAITKEITEHGGLISEYLPGTQPSAGHLINRNRLIVGLSQAVVIGEMSAESVGTLDAAQCCHELGKLLFAVIGTTNPHYEKLLEYGAIPLTNIAEYELILKSLV
ncbi:MAG: DNA-processing protein DprA [Candidatus Zixiibacteriota bacterium]